MRHKLIEAKRLPYRKRAVANGYGLDVKCVHDPTGTYPRGGMFTIKNFDYTARLRFWPAGAEFLIGITKPTPRHVRITERGDVQDVDTGEIAGFMRNYTLRWRNG